MSRPGFWGVCFIYATWFAIEALAAAGLKYSNCLAMRKGVDFLLEIQNQDGGWGESYLSCTKGVPNSSNSTDYLGSVCFNGKHFL